MKKGLQVLALLIGILVPLSTSPWAPVETAVAAPNTVIHCSSATRVVQDGVITQGEYSGSYFDTTTKVLVYFDCEGTTNRTLHVAMVSPWKGWVGLLLQASEVWNGDMNVVRVSLGEGITPAFFDGYLNSTSGRELEDVQQGGTNDVHHLAAVRTDEITVYEFALPLSSSDTYDSQLSGNGPFYFQLEYNAFDVGLQSNATGVSLPQTIETRPNHSHGEWSNLELSLSVKDNPSIETQILLVLRNLTGFPVSYAPLQVFVRTAFGFMDLGLVVTNAQGVAEVVYAPRGAGKYLVGAAFEGRDGVLASVGWVTLIVDTPNAALPLMHSDNIALSLVFLGVGGVWVAYGYALLLGYLATNRPAKDFEFLDTRGPRRGRWER
ncbi:MAG: hypothetical protein ACE5HJ_09195 [Thermoplasmata archaeon]